MEISPRPALPPGAPSEDDQARAVDVLQHAVGAGRLTLGEFTDRVDAALAAGTQAELAEVLGDLPAEAPMVGGSLSPSSFSVFGDVQLTGRWRLRARLRAITVFGDVHLDLRQALCDTPEVRIESFTVFGDVNVIVPEGVEAELSGFTIFGDRRIDLAPVPRSPNTPLVHVRGLSVFGDHKVRSLAPGEPASAWRRLLGRHRGEQARDLPPGN